MVGPIRIGTRASKLALAQAEELRGRLVAADPGAEFARCTVTDTGTGIPADVLNRMFDPFFTTKEKGTGLGLSVVYGIITSHYGTLNVESTPGQGTTVTIKLPRAVEPAETLSEITPGDS